MTNSHNKLISNNQYRGNGGQGASPKVGSPTDRFFNNNSPPYLNGSGSGRPNNNNKNNNRQQRSPSTKYFNSQPSSNICITPNKYPQRINNKTSGRSPSSSSTMSSSAVLVLGNSPFANSGGSGSPPNFSHFASSKCYDAPLPTSLPKPPHHWTSCSQEANKQGAKKFDIFSHNLKSILNVQA